jgi:uncharacterized protein DUF3732
VKLRRKEAELRAASSTADAWKAEAMGWLRQALDLGLIDPKRPLPIEWSDIIALLRHVSRQTSRAAKPTLPSIEGPLRRLEELRTTERETAAVLSNQRQKLNEVRRLVQSTLDFGASIRTKRERLSLSRWLREKSAREPGALGALTQGQHNDIQALVGALEGLELQFQTLPAISETMEREQLQLRSQIEGTLERLGKARQEIVLLERSSKEAQQAAYTYDRVERFLGGLVEALKLYDRAGDNAELSQEVRDLREQLSRLRAQLSNDVIDRRLQNAIATVEGFASQIAPTLDAEWPNALVKLSIKDLTVKIVRGTRDDYLWEIGSGANWLAYHIALSLALQRFFLTIPQHPAPGFLVYDQPSQVYFPRRLAEPKEGSEEDEDEDAAPDPEWRDEDVIAVRKVFQAAANAVLAEPGRLQTIILDHADHDVWGGIEGIKLVEEWRGGQKLVPLDWDATSGLSGR